jgi:hypothetical protein
VKESAQMVVSMSRLLIGGLEARSMCEAGAASCSSRHRLISCDT